MSFHDVRFPVEIGFGSSGGPGFKTEITELDSGQEGRVAFWSSPRHRYDVSYGIRSMDDLAAVKTFYMARQGALNSFRYKDWTDYHTLSTNPTHMAVPGTRDQQCNPTTGNGTLKTFQLVKRYVSGINTAVRNILLPVSDTVKIWVNNVLQTENTHYMIDYMTGVVTFVTAPAAGFAVEWSGEFDVKTRFEKSVDDVLNAQVEGWNLGNISSIPLIEVIDSDAPYSNEYFFGGSIEKTIAANYIIDSTAFFWSFYATVASIAVVLPDPVNYPTGGFHFCIQNLGSISIAVKNQGGTTLVNLAQNKSCMIVLTLESNNTTKTWYALGG
jgi:uncharacterized protein (TIGR02217 family)